MIQSEVATLGPQKHWGVHGGKLPRQVIETDQLISEGLVSRLHKYATDRLAEMGIAIQDGWTPIISTLDGDKAPSLRIYTVTWKTSGPFCARLGIEGIATRSGWPFMDYGPFVEET